MIKNVFVCLIIYIYILCVCVCVGGGGVAGPLVSEPGLILRVTELYVYR
jgi:hypothetical protein